MTDANVLVTGSAGHLGSALTMALPALGYNPVGIDILASDTTTYVGSITDRAFLSHVFATHGVIRYVLHAATLHKPHIDTNPPQDFVDTNISGTLALLEAAVAHGVTAFVFISTTSAFGAALTPGPGTGAVWINEETVPLPKNVYGITKLAAEGLCRLVHNQTGMPVLVLRTSRFFPEQDDDERRRAELGDENLKLLEMAYRRVDIADAVAACVCALQGAERIGWGLYVISAPTPFSKDDATRSGLGADAAAVLRDVVPDCGAVFAARGWEFQARIDRVYDSSKAILELGWEPQYTFRSAVENIRNGREWRSELALRVGKRGYHAVSTGVYTVR